MADVARPPDLSTGSSSGDEKHGLAAERLPDDLGATSNAGKETSTTANAGDEEVITPTSTSKPDASSAGPGLANYVPSWVSMNVKNPASWKMLFRCWLASWAAFILILPQSNLTVLGNACVIVFLL